MRNLAQMSEPYKKVKAGRLMFKGGDLATVKTIDKKKKKHKRKNKTKPDDTVIGTGDESSEVAAEAVEEGENVYTIDAAKKMKYEELFPVESRKFGYDPKNKLKESTSVEKALDDRVKKKADRYCK